jgi:hypothetical protein
VGSKLEQANVENKNESKKTYLTFQLKREKLVKIITKVERHI